MAKGTRFTELMKSYEREIYRFAYRMTGNSADASDVLQETFMRAFKAFASLPSDANHRAWLYRVASSQSLNLIRNERRRRSVPLEKASLLHDPEGDPAAIVDGRRLARALRVVVDGLPRRQRAALLLKKYEGLSYREVAHALKCSEENARAHVYQAMRKVRRAMREGRSS